MTEYSVSSSLRNLASYQKTAVSLSLGVHDCPHILEVVGSTGRWSLERDQKRMRRAPKKLRWPRCFHNDPVLKSNQKLYHSFVRDVNHAVCCRRLRFFFCSQIQRWIASDLGRETFERPFTSSCCLGGSHPPAQGGVLEHRCLESSPLATTCQGLRWNVSAGKKMSICFLFSQRAYHAGHDDCQPEFSFFYEEFRQRITRIPQKTPEFQ